MSRATLWVAVIAAGFAMLEVAATLFGPYGYFIDELYYLACAERLAWGYVDHPPLSIAVLSLDRALLGTSKLALRLPAILAVTAAIVVSARLARRFGGNGFSQVLAALATAASPISLLLASFYSMNAFELLLWPVLVLVLVTIAQGGDRRLWLVFGVLLGLGLMNKHTTLLVAIALAAGIVATRLRTELRTRWPWLAIALAAAIVLPNLLWQAAHGQPSLEFYARAQALKNVPTPPIKGIANQFIVSGLGSFFLWTSGAVWLLSAKQAKPLRFVGIAFVILFVLMIASRSSRPDRIAAIYPVMFGAGAVALEQWTQAHRRWLRALAVVLVPAGALIAAPMLLPLLSPDSVGRYARATGLFPQVERGKASPVPQPLADRTGWQELVDDVTRVHASLPPEERANALIVCTSYGVAGALELLGARRGLPRVAATQNNYWLWGPGDRQPSVVIAVGIEGRALDGIFESHELALVHECDHCTSWRNGMEIRVARNLRQPIGTIWPRLKNFR